MKTIYTLTLETQCPYEDSYTYNICTSESKEVLEEIVTDFNSCIEIFISKSKERENDFQKKDVVPGKPNRWSDNDLQRLSKHRETYYNDFPVMELFKEYSLWGISDNETIILDIVELKVI